jgi:hypothetical protein
MMDRDANRLDGLDGPDGMDGLGAQLERALASYTPAEAPAGLERRLTARLAAADLVPRRRPLFALGWAWAVCGLVAVLLAVVAVHEDRQTRTDAKVQAGPASRPRPAEAAAGAQAGAVLPVHRALRAAALRPVHRAPADTAAEASLSEMHAPSRPAPQAPLTAEERMLLRVVERRDPEQLAMLNPVVRASRAAESDREFQSFVEQSSTGNE